jgi:hypothetical protein
MPRHLPPLAADIEFNLSSSRKISWCRRRPPLVAALKRLKHFLQVGKVCIELFFFFFPIPGIARCNPYSRAVSLSTTTPALGWRMCKGFNRSVAAASAEVLEHVTQKPLAPVSQFLLCHACTGRQRHRQVGRVWLTNRVSTICCRLLDKKLKIKQKGARNSQ